MLKGQKMTLEQRLRTSQTMKGRKKTMSHKVAMSRALQIKREKLKILGAKVRDLIDLLDEGRWLDSSSLRAQCEEITDLLNAVKL